MNCLTFNMCVQWNQVFQFILNKWHPKNNKINLIVLCGVKSIITSNKNISYIKTCWYHYNKEM